MRVTISVTRPATLIRQRRIVSNWASRQNDVRGASPRRVSSSQYAVVWISRRNWLAVALQHDALAVAPRHGLGPRVMAVAAHHDVDCRPAGADMADDMAQPPRLPR